MTEMRWLPPEDLEPHPANPDFAADPDREEIEPLGEGEFRDDPKVTSNSHFTSADWTIISGHRRVETAKGRGWDTVRVEVVDPYKTAEDERKDVLEHNQYRVMTPGEQVNVAFEYLQLWDSEPVENLPQDRDTRSRLDGLFKESGRTIEMGLKVKWAAERGEWEGETLDANERRVARERWQALLGDEVAFSRAHDDVKRAVELTEPEETEPGEVPKPRGAFGEHYEDPPEDIEVDGPVQASIRTLAGLLDEFLHQITFSKQYTANEVRYYNLEVTQDGLFLRLSPADRIQSSHRLDKDLFEEFTLNRDEPVGVSIPADDLRGILGFFGQGEIQLDIHGKEDDWQASGIHMTDGALNYWAVAPDERDSFEDAPDWLPERSKGDGDEDLG